MYACRFDAQTTTGTAWTDPHLLFDEAGRVVVADASNMYCLNATSGAELWRMPVWNPPG